MYKNVARPLIARNAMIGNAMIGEAQSDSFPTLSLSNLFGLKSREVDRLLWGSAGRWQAGIRTTMPISKGMWMAPAPGAQALSRYQGTVQQVLKEVMDAIASHPES